MKKKRIFLFLISIFVVLVSVAKVSAIHTGFETNELPSKEKESFISNIDISLIDEEPVKKTFGCFDVNSNRLIAIGQDTLDKKTICVYSDEGVFQYGYTFNCSGDFWIEWDEENLNICFVRSSIIVSVTPEGEVLDAFEIQNSIENNSYVNHSILNTERIVGDDDYVIRNDIGLLNFLASSYSQVIVKDNNGAERIIYDVSSTQLEKMIVIISLVLVFAVLAITIIVRNLIKLERANKSQRKTFS